MLLSTESGYNFFESMIVLNTEARMIARSFSNESVDFFNGRFQIKSDQTEAQIAPMRTGPELTN